MPDVFVYDTTLRDGTQSENINFSADEKVRIAIRADDLGIHYIEGGWPGANPRDDKFFELAREIHFEKSRIVAFGSTRRPGIKPEDDPLLRTLAQCGAPAACIFGKTWDLHVERVMNNTLEENLAMIRESVAWLKGNGQEVIYDAEHFFDGFRANPSYAVQTLFAAVEGGADWVTLCDTNGGTLPHQVQRIFSETKTRVADQFPGQNVRFGIHAHNDCNMAEANSVTAVQLGATMVHGTINGYGERCGNADLTTVIPVLQLKLNKDLLAPGDLKKLRKFSRFVSEAANIPPNGNRPFVGESAFAHKGGVHVSAVIKAPEAYEHMSPELVGNRRRVLISDLSGKSNVEYKAKELGIDLTQNGLDSKELTTEIKKLEHRGYQYDAAEGSFELLLRKKLGQYLPPFELESFLVTIRKEKDRRCYSEATIKIKVGEEEMFTAAEGDGPVSALDNALRRALANFYPDVIKDMSLVDFKVRVIDGKDGTAARVKVLIESRDPEYIWNTIGVSEDIIEASWQALADSFQYRLSKQGQKEA